MRNCSWGKEFQTWKSFHDLIALTAYQACTIEDNCGWPLTCTFCWRVWRENTQLYHPTFLPQGGRSVPYQNWDKNSGIAFFRLPINPTTCKLQSLFEHQGPASGKRTSLAHSYFASITGQYPGWKRVFIIYIFQHTVPCYHQISNSVHTWW